MKVRRFNREEHVTLVVKVDSGVMHNPMPKTERGKRRHKKRNLIQQKHAEKCWAGLA